jgi:RNA polymerase sigma factor (sigma-70 family)
MTTELTDAQLVHRCREGDQQAWNTLVERFSRYVYAICVRGFRLREHDAEDVFQDVFSRVFNRLGSLRDDAAVRPWIAQLTRRLCLDKLAANQREEPTEVPSAADGDGVQDEIDEAFAVHEAMAALPENCQEILDRFFARDESYKTIGEELGLPAGTIASRISRCLARLRAMLEDEGPAGGLVGGR